jgi:hypothetical protein
VVLTEANRETLLRRAGHKTKRRIEELVAELRPMLDVPAAMRKLPDRQPALLANERPQGKL